jgi:hypothetical protein
MPTAPSTIPSIIPSDEPFTEYLAYLKAKELVTENDKLIYFGQEDLDLDKNNEVILAFGISGDDPFSAQVTKAYVLKRLMVKLNLC